MKTKSTIAVVVVLLAAIVANAITQSFVQNVLGEVYHGSWSTMSPAQLEEARALIGPGPYLCGAVNAQADVVNNSGSLTYTPAYSRLTITVPNGGGYYGLAMMCSEGGGSTISGGAGSIWCGFPEPTWTEPEEYRYPPAPIPPSVWGATGITVNDKNPLVIWTPPMARGREGMQRSIRMQLHLPAGEYTISCSSSGAYGGKAASVSLTAGGGAVVDPAPVWTVIADSPHKVYDGTPLAVTAPMPSSDNLPLLFSFDRIDYADYTPKQIGPIAGAVTTQVGPIRAMRAYMGYLDDVTYQYIGRPGRPTGRRFVGVAGTATITPKPLTVTLGGSKIFENTTTVSTLLGATATATGLVGGDVASYTFANTPSAEPGTYYPNVTVKITNTATGEDRSSSYTIRQNGSFKINQIALSLTLGGSKTYDGLSNVINTLPGATVAYESVRPGHPDGLIPGDTIPIRWGNTSAVNVGIYNEAATILADVKVMRSGVDVTNKYAIMKAGSFEITKAHQSKPTLVISPVTVPIGESASLVAAGGESSGAYVYRIASGNGMIVGSLVKPNEVGTVAVQVMRQGDINYFDSDWSDAASVGAIAPVSVKITATARGEGVTIEKVSEGQYKITLPPQ